MAQVKIYYEPEMALLTVFWQAPRKDQIATDKLLQNWVMELS